MWKYVPVMPECPAVNRLIELQSHYWNIFLMPISHSRKTAIYLYSVVQDPVANSWDLQIELDLTLSVTIAGSNAFVLGSGSSLQCAYEVSDCALLVPYEPRGDEPRFYVQLLDVDLMSMMNGCSIFGPPHDLSRRHPESISPDEGEVRKSSPGHRFVVILFKKLAEVDGIFGLGDCGEQSYDFSRAGRRPLY